MPPPRSIQLLVYAFGPGAALEGRLVGALERIESGGALRVLEALYLRREPGGSELTAIDVRGRGAGGLTAPLLSFRLDPAARRRATERALAGGPGVEPATLRELADGLEPGSALVAVLVEHVWAGALDDAVERTGGVAVADAFVDATELSELTPELLAASRPGNG